MTPGSDLHPRRVHAGPDRTLLAVHSSGRKELWKILESGSLAQAQREVELGRSLAVAGVARYLEARLEEGTGRPVVVMEHHPGSDLEELVGRDGPLDPRTAVRIAARLAAILEVVHEQHGLVHGDVKPGNVLVDPEREPEEGILLLDFEHAGPLGAGGGRVFTGGSHGFAPPEAYEGAALGRSHDVFGLGATLLFTLLGRFPLGVGEVAAARRGRIDPELWATLPHELAAVVAGCLAPDPAKRWSFGRVAATCEKLAAGDAKNGALHTGDAGQRDLQLPEVAAEQDPGQQLKALVAGFERLEQVLEEQPAAAEALVRRNAFRRKLVDALLQVPPAVQCLRRNAMYRDADALLLTAVAAVEANARSPGSLPWAGVGRLAGPLERDPLRFLAALRAELAGERGAHSKVVQSFEEAAGHLDLEAAAAAVESATEEHGGASGPVARLRDRLHALGFSVERIAAATGALTRVRSELENCGLEAELGPLEMLVGHCRAQTRGETAEYGGAVLGLRSLSRTLRDLGTEVPGAVDTVAPARACLAEVTDLLTDRAWELLAEAEQGLRSVPVPVRPLQSLLHRLDALRLVEALGDRRGRSRTELLDGIERVRSLVDRARATRDRIASGAEEALARGHWTTALFEMERAVEQFAQGEEDEQRGAGQMLAARFEETKQRKGKIEEAMRANVELASSYLAALDREGASTKERLDLLGQRSVHLEFLLDHLQGDRAQGYQQDLLEVQLQEVQEEVVEAERVLDGSEDPAQWVAVCRQTLELLQGVLTGRAAAAGRLQRMVDHWQHRLEHAEREVERTQRAAARRRRRRVLQVSGAAALLVVAALLFDLPAVFARSGAEGRWLERMENAPHAAESEGRVSRILALAAFGSDFAEGEEFIGREAVAAVETVVAAATGSADQDLDAALTTLRTLIASHGPGWPPGIRSAIERFTAAADLVR